jgi:hypothetical protein
VTGARWIASSAPVDRGVLQPGDPLLAAAHFNWLVMSIPLNRAMLLGEDEPPASAELNQSATWSGSSGHGELSHTQVSILVVRDE